MAQLVPGCRGIFFDEMANAAGQETYYSGLAAYAKGRGRGFTIGNPGADSSPSYVGTEDVILIYESGGLPALSALGGWHTRYNRNNFGVIPYKPSAAWTRRSCGRAAVRRVHLPAERQPAEPLGQRPDRIWATCWARCSRTASDARRHPDPSTVRTPGVLAFSVFLAVAVVGRVAHAGAAAVAVRAGAGGDRDVAAGGVAVLRISDQQLRGAGVAVVRAGGRAGGAEGRRSRRRRRARRCSSPRSRCRWRRCSRPGSSRRRSGRRRWPRGCSDACSWRPNRSRDRWCRRFRRRSWPGRRPGSRR